MSIEWENDDTGMETNFYGGSSRVYTRQYAIKMACSDYLKQLVARPKNLLSQKCDEYKEYAFAPLPAARPRFSQTEMRDIRIKMSETVPRLMVSYGKDDLTNELDDFTFLLSLGLKRNWKSECPICLSEEMMGTTCGCGHTEIVVFRPCGHSICASPCFEEFIKVGLKEAEMKIDGQTFIVAGKMDIDNCKDFGCPTCRRNVEACFRAEDVWAPKDMLNSIVGLLSS